MKIHAHRGFSSNYPESTMLAYEKALEHDADFFEMDIWETSDGEIVIIHDSTVTRTVRGGYTNSVSSSTLSFLKTLDFSYPGKFGDTYKGRSDCKIVTLDEIIDRFKKEDVNFTLNLQSTNTSYLNKVYSKIKNADLIDRTWFFGTIDMINSIKKIDVNTFTVNSGMPNYSNYKTFLNNALEKGHNAVSITANDTIENTKTMVNDILSKGLRVYVSYVSEDFYNKAQFFKSIGVTDLLGDNPLLMRKDVKVVGDGVIENVYVKVGSGWVEVESIINDGKIIDFKIGG